MSEQNTDAAAEAAVASFFSEAGREQAAAKEVPDSAPSNVALANEYADQASSLEQDGTVDPTGGTPTETQPVVAATPAPAAAAEAVTETGLDPILRAVAEEAGWKSEKIDKFYATDPEFATEVFGKLVEDYANVSRQFLAVPAPAPQAVAAPQTPAQVPAQTKQSSDLPVGLTDEALAKFAEENGEQSANLLKQLRDFSVARISALETRQAESDARTNEVTLRAVATEAETVVSGLQKQFPKLYGTALDPNTLTVAAREKITELGTLADQMRAGAARQGRTLTVAEAMKRAHYIVAKDSLKTEAREEILAKVKQRAKSATARPTQRANPTASGNKRSDAAAIEAAAQFMSEIGMTDDT